MYSQHPAVHNDAGTYILSSLVSQGCVSRLSPFLTPSSLFTFINLDQSVNAIPERALPCDLWCTLLHIFVFISQTWTIHQHEKMDARKRRSCIYVTFAYHPYLVSFFCFACYISFCIFRLVQ